MVNSLTNTTSLERKDMPNEEEQILLVNFYQIYNPPLSINLA